MTTRTTRIGASRLALTGCAVFGALLTSPAIAGLPQVLDHVPADATAVVVVNNLGDFDQHFGQFIGAIEMPMMPTPGQTLNQLGIGQNLNMDSSAALVVLSIDVEKEDGQFVFLAPTRNFNALVNAFGAEDSGGGIKSFTVESDTVFAKSIGDWAAMSTDRGVIEAFTGKAGNLGTFQANLGAAGMELAESSDLFVTLNPADMAPLAEMMHERMQEQMQMFAGPGGEQMQQQMQVMHQLVDGFVRDGSHAGFGFRFGAMGASVNGSVAFKPGTQGARLFTRGGDSGSLLSKLPGGPFLAAFAMDQTAPFAKATMEWFQKSGMADMNPAMGAMGMRDLQNNMTGVAGAIYPNSAGIMGGLLANMIMYSASDDPGKLMAMTRDKMSAMNVNEPALGMSITASYTPGETNIAGKKADGYAINFAMAGMDAAGAMFNPMSMIFGSPNGPSGYLIEANGGVYQSFSRNSTMLAPAVEGRSPLTDDRAVAEVAGRLPKNRYAEAYIGVRPIMEQVMPFLGMLGVPPMDLPAQMPPVGLGVASRDGGAVFGAFVPSQTIKSAIQIGMSAQNAVGGFGGNDNGPGF